ncbi:MAG: hypothetical protein GQF41_1056 [Candidatus Rifleibacterium amylolyticum]|nr:MAG: hypothetical protein GQF41_1056 [Candidatus Rifleibacterium amylolyticum]
MARKNKPADEKQKPFDPWTATIEEALREFNAGNEKAIFQSQAVADIMACKPRIEEAMKVRGNEAGNSPKLRLVAEAGHAILYCVKKILDNELIAPEWLSYAFNQRYYPVAHHKARTWSSTQSFGDSTGKKKLENRRKARALRMFLMGSCATIHTEYRWLRHNERLKTQLRKLIKEAKDGALISRYENTLKELDKEGSLLRGETFLSFLTERVKRQPELSDFGFDTIRKAYNKLPKTLKG